MVRGSTKPNSTPTQGRTFAIGFLFTLLFGGLALMLIHHFFYSFLNGKSIDSGAAELPSIFTDQSTISFIGTAIAHCDRAVLSMAIGVSFAQLFWESLRSRSHTIHEIDALVKCGESPIHLTAFVAARASFSVLLVSAIASAMSLIVIFAPGSLTVSSNVQRNKSCTVPNVPGVMDSNFSCATTTGIGEANTDCPFDFRYMTSTSGILTAGTYLPPFRAFDCDAGASSCSYNVSFVAPAFDCIDVTTETNFSSFIDPHPSFLNVFEEFHIWEGTAFDDPNDLAIGVSVLTQDMVRGKLQANNCTARSATYSVGVLMDEVSSTLQVQDVSLGRTLRRERREKMTNSIINYFADSVVDPLTTSLSGGANGYVQVFGGHGTFLVTTPSGNFTFSDDNIKNILTSFMQNASLSLLSGAIYTGFSNETSSNFEYVESTCSSVFTAYVYEPKRLLLTYGIALGVTLVAIIPGLWLVRRNGIEEKLVFSQILRFALNERLFRISSQLCKGTLVRLECGEPGELVPSFVASSGEAYQKVDHEDFSAEGKQNEHIEAHDIATSNEHSWLSSTWQMVTLFLSALCCMIMHHFFYNFLDWRAPSSSTESVESWLQDQPVVSNIGIALAFAAQTLFVGVLGIASVQLLWRRLRIHEHCIVEIDSIMKARNNIFSPSSIRAWRACFAVPLLAVLSSSTSVVSIFAPGAIKVSFDRRQTKDCTVLNLRNLSAFSTLNESDYSTQLSTVLSGGFYLPPRNPCTAQCSYSLDFIGPGFDCIDVTSSSNYTAFAASTQLFAEDTVNLYNAFIVSHSEDMTMRMSVQTWDTKTSVFQAVNCTGTAKSYSVLVSHNSSSTIYTRNSHTISPLIPPPDVDLSETLGNLTDVISFMVDYAWNAMFVLSGERSFESDANVGDSLKLTSANDQVSTFIGGPHSNPLNIGGLGTYLLDGNFTWRANMTTALEEYMQNATLSLLSGQIFGFGSSGGPDILENISTTCAYSVAAYEYTPYRLFLAYGFAAIMAGGCMIWGLVAIHKNGADESLSFYHLLRAVLNEKMFRWYVEEEFHRDLNLEALVVVGFDERNRLSSFKPVLGGDFS